METRVGNRVARDFEPQNGGTCMKSQASWILASAGMTGLAALLPMLDAPHVSSLDP